MLPVAALVMAPAAGAMTAAPGYAVADFATSFPNSGPNSVGPVGLAFDGAGVGSRLYVTGYFDNALYRFPAGGGMASAATRLGPLPGRPAGIAFSLDFAHLYVARQSAADVVEVDAGTGAVIRTVVSGIGCATGLVTDPLSGDLFVSQPGCSNQILRVVPSTGATSVYTSATGADGLSFDPRDGTLYAAAGGSTIAVIDRAGGATFINGGPGAATLDGIAVAASRVPGQPPFVFVDQNNGLISKIDLTTSPPTTSTAASGGSRGDLVTVGPDGCLYGTQTDRVVRVTNADGSCSLAPPDPAITAVGVSPITATEGATFSGVVAVFTDPDVLATADEYAATIGWGDGSSSTGTIAATPTPGRFTVSGGHTYGEEGSYTVTVDVADIDTPNNAATATSSVAVADAPLAGSGSTVSGVEGSSLTAAVATFTDADPAGTAADYSATVDWGDGATSAGTIGGTTTFSVSGTHTYLEEGTYAITVHIADAGGSATTAGSRASVADAPLTASGTSLTTTNPVNGVVAHFADADPAGTVSDYTATVSWGDGASSAGTVSASGSGFDVSGSHAYAALGPYTVHVHICDAGGSCADASTQLLVFAFPAGGGDFVVGDRSATGPVTFWGAQWAKVNSLSGGAAPASFKGFADSSTPVAPACGGTWTTGPGNSAGPPSAIPSFMAVIVSSATSKAGPVISGNEVHVVVVRTDPGYAPDPGHGGTGTVVGVVC
jgi:hypothetical protein